MSDCTHDCSSCGESCAERQEGSPFQIKPLREGCRVGKVYGVVSGKGGVGKSMVTSQLAVTMQRRGHNVAVLDADITGPSIPKAFGIHGRAVATEDAILPVITGTGIQLMSVNLLLKHETDPVIWRGPVIGRGCCSTPRRPAETGSASPGSGSSYTAPCRGRPGRCAAPVGTGPPCPPG